MPAWNDLYLLYDATDRDIAVAVASAFDVPVSRLAVTPTASIAASTAWDRPNLYALIQRDNVSNGDPKAEFVWEVSIAMPWGEPKVDELETLKRIGEKLGVPFLASIGLDGQDTMRLVLPDGQALPRMIDDDDGPVLSETDRALLNRYRSPASHAAAS